MSQVFFFSYEKNSDPLKGLDKLFAKSGFADMIPEGKPAAIKLHMGELGNIRYIRPVFVRKVVDIVKREGGRPFLFDTVANYPSARNTKRKYLRTAAMNGFVRASAGAPIVITDDGDDLRAIPVRKQVADCDVTEVKVPSVLLESACVVVLSHVKGHEMAGFGGALKNLAMGCVSNETKRAQHLATTPLFKADADCSGCGDCADACPTDAITLVEGKPQRAAAKCIYCSTCYFLCPSHCWAWPEGAKEKLQVNLAHTASAVLSGYRGKIAYVNLIQDVAPDCDCVAPSGRPVVQDVGIAFSFDPVAIDKASVDLVDKSPIIPGSTSARPPDLLGKIHNTNSLVQLEIAERLKLGTMQYRLVSV